MVCKPVVVFGCANQCNLTHRWIVEKKKNCDTPLCDYMEKTWHPYRQTDIKHVYRCFSLISASSILAKKPLVLGRHCCHAANCLPRWTIADRRWRGERKWQECCTELLLIHSFEPFVLQKVKSWGEAGAEVQTKPPSPPLLSSFPNCTIWGRLRSEAFSEAAVKFLLTVKLKPCHTISRSWTLDWN